jgi:hypothetical protein
VPEPDEFDISRATGGEPPTPPAKPARVDPAGYRPQQPAVGLPLGDGQVITSNDETRHYTPTELQALQQTGWKEGMPIPDNVAMAAALAAQASGTHAPIPMDTPPLAVETVDISQLDPGEQARILQGNPTASTPPVPTMPPDLSGMLSQPAAAVNAPPQPAPIQPQARPQMAEPVSVASQAVPGWTDPNNPAIAPTVQNPQSLQQPVAPAGVDGAPLIYNDLPPQPQMPAQQPAAPAASVPSPEEMSAMVNKNVAEVEEAMSNTMGGGSLLKDCPHCGWDLAMPEHIEPTPGEKQAFLQSILGQMSFIQDIDLLGGALKVRFRTLSTREIDLIYKQVMYEQRNNMIPTLDDYWEKINRYRLYLQLLRVEFTGATQGIHEYPDGYSKEANPNATRVWKFGEIPVDQTGLPQIESYLLQKIFVNEIVQRSINNQCGQFNRLVAKMEAMVDNSDFWKTTGEPS